MFKCACGDTPFSIPKDRAGETYMDGAFWCSGTLNMLGVDQNPLVIFNPYSYRELQTKLTGLDRYLECVSTIGMGEIENTDGETCESKRPVISELENQGVSSIAVLTRCKANYAASQWDEGASILFQSDAIFEKMTRGKAKLAGLLWMKEMVNTAPVITAELKACLLATADAGQSPDACLSDVFLKNKKKEDYFVYETMNALGTNDESMLVDACEVHTGPASEVAELNARQNITTTATGNEFQYCIDNDLSTQCNIPSFVWSGRSSGKTPVANYHSWTDMDEVGSSEKMKRALIEFEAISKKMSGIIRAVNDTFNKEGISAELFSAEGGL